MKRKLPLQMAASGRSSSERGAGDGSEDPGTEIVVDRSDDVTVEAQEDVTTEAPATREAALDFDVDDDEPEAAEEPTATPAPLLMGESEPRVSSQTLLGMLAPSLPLPGVTAPSSYDASNNGAHDEIHELDDLEEGNEEVTVLANPLEPLPLDSLDPLARLDRFDRLDEESARPSVTEDDEEETKVEAAATAAHAAASRDDEDDVLAALSEQASVEREKALRKSSVFGSQNLSGRGVNDLEFADPDEDEEAAVMGSADLVAEDDDEDGESAGTYPKSVDPSPLAAAFTARRLGSPPMGSAFGSRLPTPSPGFGGLSLSSPVAQAPAPTNSPFGRLAAVPAGSPYGGRAGTGTMPALQIPAPSGTAAPTAGGSFLFRRVSGPLGAFIAFLLASVGVGVLIGASLPKGGSSPRTVTAAPAAPVVQPVTATPGNEPAPAPAGTTPTMAGTTAKTTAPGETAPTPLPSAGPSIDPIATSATAETAPPAPKLVKRARPKKSVAAETEDEEAAAPAAPKPAPKAATKPAKVSKPSKAWVDPFAQ